jgi:phosphate transport system substrate-binding protein
MLTRFLSRFRLRSAALLGPSGLLAMALVLAAPSAGFAVTYAQIEGTGSTWSQVIVSQWIADVDSKGMKVVYSGGGSSKGRKDFANNTTDFGITEVPYGSDGDSNDKPGTRQFAYLPIVAGGTAFTYQIKVGGNLVKNLRLSGETITKIFANKITNWNDAAITKDNNGKALPSLPIIPVVRSDGSGTSAQFTRWMKSEYSSIWTGGQTSFFPKSGKAVGQSGSDQVMNFIASSAGNGTIGYIEYSYAVNKNYPVVKVLNKGGYFVEPTQYNVAVALTKAVINPDLTQNLDGVYRATDPRAYPLSSYSYMLIPTGKTDTRMGTTATKRQTLADFMFYSLCEGQGKAGNYGYSPLPYNLVTAGFDQLKKLKTADARVDITGRDPSRCSNPTFDKSDLKKNKLAEIAPQPAACDKLGAGPCGGDTGTAPTTVDEAEKTDTTQDSGSAAPASAAAASGSDPAAGGAVAADGAVQAQGGSAAVPVDLVASRAGDTRTFGIVAVIELLAITLIPGLAAVYLRRRDSQYDGGA